LVPFGERIPYDDVFTFLKNVNFGEGDFERETPVLAGDRTRQRGGEVQGTTFSVSSASVDLSGLIRSQAARRAVSGQHHKR
jgi:hypothetical protein